MKKSIIIILAIVVILVIWLSVYIMGWWQWKKM